MFKTPIMLYWLYDYVNCARVNKKLSVYLFIKYKEAETFFTCLNEILHLWHDFFFFSIAFSYLKNVSTIL